MKKKTEIEMLPILMIGVCLGVIAMALMAAFGMNWEIAAVSTLIFECIVGVTAGVIFLLKK
jgi:hypothetical protein